MCVTAPSFPPIYLLSLHYRQCILPHKHTDTNSRMCTKLVCFFVGYFTLDANAILAVLVFVGVVRCTFNLLGINIITSLLAAQILERLGNSYCALSKRPALLTALVHC